MELAELPDVLRLKVVRAAGIEPARPCGLRILSPVRLPIPPCPRMVIFTRNWYQKVNKIVSIKFRADL